MIVKLRKRHIMGKNNLLNNNSESLPLSREHMPTDYSISLSAYTKKGTSDEKRIPNDFGLKQSLNGFEKTYQNIIDYIVRITYKIWEDRDVEYILDTYSPNSKVFDDYGLQLGNQKIVDDTFHTTGAFSNIKLIADEVIWAGNDKIGFHTSHRTIIRGTNDGPSKYGPATNKDIDVIVIANCVALKNRIFLEHVCYNTSSMILQMGMNLDDMVKKFAASAPLGWPRDQKTWDDLKNTAQPEIPIFENLPISGFDVDHFLRITFENFWNKRNYDKLNHNFVENLQFEGATNRKFNGLKDYQEFLKSLTTCFSDLELQVDEVYWMGNEIDGFLSSTRWSASGTHNGFGVYGPPTGLKVQIWGITQNEIQKGKITKEWMLFNEMDLMMQIAASNY